MPSSTEWKAGNETFKHQHLVDLLGERLVLNEILDGCLRLVFDDLRRGVWDTAFGEGPETSSPDPGKVIVMTWSDVYYMMKGSPLDQPGGLVPPKKTTDFWFPDVS